MIPLDSTICCIQDAKVSGKKFNYEVDEIVNVYDVVDESEYADEVQKKRDSEWIIDDDGGYVEDGREIFDDDEDDIYAAASGSKKKKGEKEKPKKEEKKGANIKNMLLSMPTKKQKEVDVKIDDDEILGDILGKLQPRKQVLKKPTHSAGSKAAKISNSETDRNPFVKKGTGLKKTVARVSSSGDHEPAPSQVIEEFEAPASQEDGFDEEMVIEDMDDDLDFSEPMTEEEKPAAEELKQDNRGFIEQKPATMKDSGKGWKSSSVQQTITADINVDLSTFPLTKVELTDPDTGVTSTEDVLKMYWLDAYEDAMKHPGMIWLFGKVWIESAGSFVSCCLTVKNIPRRIFLAKRELFCDHKTGVPLPGDREVSPMDLYNEFNTKIAKRYKIMEHKCRPVEKCYAFEHSDVPNVGQYLEVIYSSDYPALPPDLKGETFFRVFGTPQTALEHFLLEQKLKGPGWVYVKGAVPHSPPTSWCRLEALVTDPAAVLPASIQDETPPLVIMTVKTGTYIHYFYNFYNFNCFKWLK